ncbi:hypothetical protein DPMN_034645 [Dreissena polymorpha]|uniref:Uncharacterized protein n=1 Tax=Dreissena polymorpha TaxID=45954 RepID=A0A9D4M7W0_DREPO|nr:hypothetical protein DPMN_034645 [Dreissena polymorpha]
MVSQTQKKKNQTGIIYKLSRDIIKNVLIEINDDCLLARPQYITSASNNCPTSFFHYSHIRKLPYPTVAMFLKGQGPFSNYADISFEKKVICKSHNDCAKHQTSRVSQGLTIPML